MKRIFTLTLCAVFIVSLFVSCSKPIEKLSVTELLDLGEKFLVELDYEQAIVAFTKIIEIEPKNAQAYIGLADAYMGIGDMEKATEWLNKGLDQIPDSDMLKRKLADISIVKDIPEEKGEETAATQYNTIGNTNGNVINGGMAAIQGDYVFCTYPEGIYKVDLENNTQTLIYSGNSDSLAVVGEWIFFYGFKAELNLNGFFKIKIDGTELTHISDPDIELVKEMNVIENWIYFIGLEADISSSLYKMKIDGSGLQKLDSQEIQCLNYYNGYIYYVKNDFSNDFTNNGIFKIKLDGSEKIKIQINVEKSQYVSPFMMLVKDGYAYFCEDVRDLDPKFDIKNGEPVSGLCRLDLNNGELVLLIDNDEFNDTFDYLFGDILNIDKNGCLYCEVYDDSELSGTYEFSGTYKVNLESLDIIRFSDDDMFNLSIVGDWLYFIRSNYDSYGNYRMRIYGTDREEIW